MSANPFKPGPGVSPPELIGRDASLQRIEEGIVDGPGAPGRIALFTGARGVGKTVMLNEAESRYQAAGWHCINVGATARMLDDLAVRVGRLIDLEAPPARRTLRKISLPGGAGAEWDVAEPSPRDLRSDIERLLDLLVVRGAGLFVTIDEVHGGDKAQLREIATITQLMNRHDRQFAIAMAGLPAAVSEMLSDDVLTFMRRADRHDLQSLYVDDVEDALRATIESHHRTIDDEGCRLAAEATDGYPYLVQLVGYQVWRSTGSAHIDRSSVTRGVENAKRRLRDQVHGPALKDLSDGDRAYLKAMSADDGPSRTADIAQRLGQSPQYANTYRRRLIAAGVVESPARGRVDLAIPYLRESLRDLS